MKINGTFKKTAIATLSLVTACLFVFAVGGCKKKKNTKQPTDGVTITLNQNTLALDLDETFTLVATVTGTEESVVWSTDDAAVATVDASGVVTGVEDGQTKIYATIGEDKATCTVTVEEGLRGLPNFYIDYGTLNIYKDYTSDVVGVFSIGKEEQQISADDVVWSSSDSTVASVSGGTITGVKAGVASITAKYVYEGVTYEDTINVTVKELVAYLVDTADDVIATATTYGGKTNTAYATTQIEIKQIFGTQVSELTDFSGITFTSENEEIATVDENGVITGVAPGTATIKAESISASGEVEIEVYSAINSKHDLDMLALAYARGTATTDWGTSAKYMLTDDIDYAGEIFIPIAAIRTTGGDTAYSIGRQWKEKIFTDETKYSISYADFVKTGLNDGTAFNATIDGNGFAVQNAKLMLDAEVGTTSASSAYATGASVTFHTNFIGSMGASGVLKNISIENLGVQTIAEAGYNVQNTLPTVGANIAQQGYDTILYNAAGYMKTNMFGVFGIVAGTFENVYAEWKPTAVTVGRYTNTNYAFGRWDGGKMTDCIFVDACVTANADSDYRSIRFRADYTTIVDNVMLVYTDSTSNVKDSRVVYDSTPSGTFTAYKGFAALQTAYTSDNTLFNGFDDWTITLQNNKLTCEIKDGIAG